MAVSSWLKFFRVVNLPTVPGDVLVGAAAALAWSGHSAFSGGSFHRCAMPLAPVWWAAASSVFIYMFGLAQNDIFGAKTDRGRPLSDGEILKDSALAAATACLAAAALCACFGGLFKGSLLSPGSWTAQAVLLVAVITMYNRTKRWWLMGACRGLNVLLGASAACASGSAIGASDMRPLFVAVIWWLYISLVTLYSIGEESDSEKKRRVGLLVGGIVYLQLAALIVFTLTNPALKPLLIAGALLLILLRVMRRALPKVSAS